FTLRQSDSFLPPENKSLLQIHFDFTELVILPAGCLWSPTKQCFDPRQELLRVEGFGQVIIGADAQTAYLIGCRIASSEHQHGSGDALLPHVFAYFETVRVRQDHIHDDKIEVLVTDLMLRIAPGVHALGEVAVPLEQILQNNPERRLVLDNKNSVYGPRLRHFVDAGTCKTNRVSSTDDLTSIRPPSAFMMDPTIYKPRPFPGVRDAFFPRKNGSKMWGRSAALMARP